MLHVATRLGEHFTENPSSIIDLCVTRSQVLNTAFLFYIRYKCMVSTEYTKPDVVTVVRRRLIPVRAINVWLAGQLAAGRQVTAADQARRSPRAEGLDTHGHSEVCIWYLTKYLTNLENILSALFMFFILPSRPLP